MSPVQRYLIYAHLATILPAFIIGTTMFLRKKGTASHKIMGRVYMVLMLVTAVITLFMTAQVGPKLFSHFGFIHLFSLLTIYGIPAGYFAIKRGDVKGHRASMIGIYVGGILIAGGFAFAPGRLLNRFLFG